MDQAALGMISQDGQENRLQPHRPALLAQGLQGQRQRRALRQDADGGNIVQLTNTDLEEFREFRQDVMPMWGADGMIYFLSERDGIFNIWKIAPAGGTPVQVTFHKKDGIQFPSISPDGTEIVYECEFDLWKMRVPDRTAGNESPWTWPSTPRRTGRIPCRRTAGPTAFARSPKGDALAVDFHGEIFIVPTEEGIGEMRQVTSSPWRDRFEAYSPDGKYPRLRLRRVARGGDLAL